jgi:hypothetical protein
MLILDAFTKLVTGPLIITATFLCRIAFVWTVQIIWIFVSWTADLISRTRAAFWVIEIVVT